MLNDILHKFAIDEGATVHRDEHGTLIVDLQKPKPEPQAYYAVWDGDGCICDGYDREQVIAEAESIMEEAACEAKEWGEGYLDAELSIDTDEGEKREPVRLTWYAENCNYDGGAWDYYNSR